MPDGASVSRKTLLAMGAAIRECSTGARSGQEVALRIVSELQAHLRDPQTGAPMCVLARLFQTRAYGTLPADLRAFAVAAAGGGALPAETRCLTLLATSGDLPEWNAPGTSVAHRTIPLTGEEMLQQSPMIAQLFTAFGLEPRDVIVPGAGILLSGRTGTYDIFHVPQALGSRYVPAQESFVRPHGVASVIGFGGPLTGNDLFATILFSRVPRSAEDAAAFASVALSAKLALLAASALPVFEPAHGA